MTECQRLSSLHIFQPFDIIYAEDRGLFSETCFILNGECSIIQCLKMFERNKRFKLTAAKKIAPIASSLIQLFADQTCSDGSEPQSSPVYPHSSGTNLIFHFVNIGQFRRGSVFGLGEAMDDRIVVARNCVVECLMIPRYWLLQKRQNVGNIWNRFSLRLKLFQSIQTCFFSFTEQVSFYSKPFHLVKGFFANSSPRKSGRNSSENSSSRKFFARNEPFREPLHAMCQSCAEF